MDEPERIYEAALVDFKKAQSEYAAAESNLIKARRALGAAGVGTAYYRALHANQQLK